MLLRSALSLFALVWVTAVTALPAQQVTDSMPAQDSLRAKQDSIPSATPQAGRLQAPAPGISRLGPRLSPQFQTVRPQLAPSNEGQRSSYMDDDDGQTITISTVTLLLIIIIVILLVK